MAPVSHAALGALVVSAATIAHAQGGRARGNQQPGPTITVRGHTFTQLWKLDIDEAMFRPCWPRSSDDAPGGSPYVATWLAQRFGLRYVGYYLSAAAVPSIIERLATRETKDEQL